MTNDRSKMLRIIGFISGIAGIGLNYLSGWLNDQKMEQLAEEKVNAAFEKKQKEES